MHKKAKQRRKEIVCTVLVLAAQQISICIWGEIANKTQGLQFDTFQATCLQHFITFSDTIPFCCHVFWQAKTWP